MKFNRECLINLMKFIEENLTFESTTVGNIVGFPLTDFINKYPNYPLDEIRYTFYLIKTLEFIKVDPSMGIDYISGFTTKGCEIVLKEIHKV